MAHDHDNPPDERRDDNDGEAGVVDPRKHGAGDHACGVAAEFEQRDVPPPAPGTPMMFPLDDAGIPKGAVIVVREAGHDRDADVYDVVASAIRLGRGPDNDIVVPNRSVSKRHMRVSFAEGAVVVEDTCSSSGTFVNGKRLSGPQRLYEGDWISVGTFTVELVRIPS